MKVTLEFENALDADDWIGWWLDGGGEQDANFNTTSFDIEKKVMHISPKSKGLLLRMRNMILDNPHASVDETQLDRLDVIDKLLEEIDEIND